MTPKALLTRACLPLGLMFGIDRMRHLGNMKSRSGINRGYWQGYGNSQPRTWTGTLQVTTDRCNNTLVLPVHIVVTIFPDPTKCCDFEF